MRYWKGQAAVNCLNQSTHSQSWCELCVNILPHLSPLLTQKKLAETIVDPKFQSPPCLTISYTYDDETFEGPNCCELLESVQTHMILV